MKPENVAALKERFPYLWHDSISRLPDGWFSLTETLLSEIDALDTNGFRAERQAVVSLRLFLYPGSAEAFIAPNVEMIWIPRKSQALVTALHRFNLRTRETCEQCGQPAKGLLKYQFSQRRDETLCADHMDERQTEIAAQEAP